MGKVCAFFGHRQIFLTPEENQNLINAIHLVIQKYHITEFWVGGYGDFDRLAAEAVRALKKQYSDVRLCLVQAYLNSKRYMPALYDWTFYPEGQETVPQKFAISARNKYMLQHCDCVIGYVKNPFGGAWLALKQAARYKYPIINCAQKEK